MFKAPSPNFRSFSFFFFLILILCGQVRGRILITTDQSSSDLISDGGIHQDLSRPFSYLRLNPFSLGAGVAEATCKQSYGFLPCTTTALGNLFLIIVYGYLMYVAATYLSNGSELLLEILGPGIVGGLFLPMLGALPDAMLILGNSLFSFFFPF